MFFRLRPQTVHTRRSSRNAIKTIAADILEDRALLSAWFASANGSATNAGTIDSPWDISSALMNATKVAPGDTLYLRGGTYRHPNRTPGSKGYSIHLEGAESAPITVRPFENERVTIDGGLQSYDSDPSQHLVITGLEVIVAENLTQSRVSAFSGSNAPPDLLRPWGGIDIRSGDDIQLINNIVHHNMQGIGIWGNVSGDSGVYGNVIYDNGWIAPDRNHGHGIYAQNATADWKYFSDNILLDNFSLNMQAYGSTIARVDRINVSDNIFSKGTLSENGGILIGGEYPSQSIRAYDNFGLGSFKIGYVDGGNDLIATGNKAWGDFSWMTTFTNATVHDNFAWQSEWSRPRVDGVEVPIPTTPFVTLNVNTHDANLAHLAFLNFPNLSQTQVDLSGFLNVGDSYQILDPKDQFGTPIRSGVYQGGSVTIPLNSQLNAYIVKRVAESTQPPPPPSNAVPTISNIGNIEVFAGQSSPTVSFTVGDAETPAGSLTLSAQSSNPGLLPASSMIFGGSGANRTLRFSTATGLSGSATITVKVTDANGAVGSDQFNVVISLLPVAYNDAYSAIQGNTLTVLTSNGVLANDMGALGHLITAKLKTTTAHGTLDFYTDGSFVYVHDGSDFLSDSFTYRAFDGTFGGNVASVTISVTPAPSIVASFQDGTGGYTGTTDTYIYDRSKKYYGTDTKLFINGNPDTGALIKWDISDIPPGAIVESVDVVVYVTDSSKGLYPIYGLNREFGETTANWNQADTGQNWQTAGALGALDRDATALFNSPISATGSQALTLNAAGVDLVQQWINDPTTNHGLIFQNYSANSTDKFLISSSENANVSQRPKLVIGYRVEGLVAEETAAATMLPPDAVLTPDNLADVVQAAKNNVIAALAEEDRMAAAMLLDSVEVIVDELPDDYLGTTSDNLIRLDRDAAGVGWFIDTTPLDNSEFVATGQPYELEALDQRIAERYDLLTVLEHEFGHVLGLDHSESNDLMNETLPPGIRRTIDSDVFLS